MSTRAEPNIPAPANIRADANSCRDAHIRADTIARRAVDIVVAALMLVVLLPVFGIVAIAVRLDSKGPVFYPAPRVGRHGTEFHMWKFRSMRADADRVGAAVSGRDDPRVTRTGRVLRATKLDELPQLVNVLAGTMTMIGPRAESPAFLRYYTQAERALLDVRPGLTGPGQLEFTARQASELDGVDDPDRYYVDRHLHGKLALDLEYLRHRGFMRDVAVVTATLRVVLGARPKTTPGA